MISKSDRARVRALLTEAVTMLCKNGLQYKSGFSVEGLLGITVLDDEQVFLININEVVKNELAEAEAARQDLPGSPGQQSHRARKRARKRERRGSSDSTGVILSDSSAEESEEIRLVKIAKVEDFSNTQQSPLPNRVNEHKSRMSGDHMSTMHMHHQDHHTPSSIPPFNNPGISLQEFSQSSEVNPPVNIKQEHLDASDISSGINLHNLPAMPGASPSMGALSSPVNFPPNWDPSMGGGDLSASQQKRSSLFRLTTRGKQELCLYQKEHPNLSQAQIREHFNHLWGISFTQQAMNRHLTKSDKWLSLPMEADDALPVYMINGSDYQLEKALKWFSTDSIGKKSQDPNSDMNEDDDKEMK